MQVVDSSSTILILTKKVKQTLNDDWDNLSWIVSFLEKEREREKERESERKFWDTEKYISIYSHIGTRSRFLLLSSWVSFYDGRQRSPSRYLFHIETYGGTCSRFEIGDFTSRNSPRPNSLRVWYFYVCDSRYKRYTRKHISLRKIARPSQKLVWRN